MYLEWGVVCLTYSDFWLCDEYKSSFYSVFMSKSNKSLFIRVV